MSIFTWNDSYSVGVIAMDNQHKKIFDLINQLHTAMSTGKGKEVIGNVLDEMLEYTQTHFTAEEKLLEKHNYPKLAEQKKEHAFFIQKVNEMKQKMHAGSLTLSLETSVFLKDWLSHHISGLDKEYGKFFNDEGIK
jgi:hemerythrin